MKFLATSCFLLLIVIYAVSGIPYGPRDRGIESHHSSDGKVSTTIERIDGGQSHHGHNSHHGHHGGWDTQDHFGGSRDAPHSY
ncbi:hypothetical protein WA026_002169 [Henosepilachna vigintioctopunctata]|uniref:Uncharacterized protein n=1 Tax=Henosepilachna vigintioctopunctata TaxID=420089 RepID=A0AAW1U1K1_9CUCU